MSFRALSSHVPQHGGVGGGTIKAGSGSGIRGGITGSLFSSGKTGLQAGKLAISTNPSIRQSFRAGLTLNAFLIPHHSNFRFNRTSRRLGIGAASFSRSHLERVVLALLGQLGFHAAVVEDAKPGHYADHHDRSSDDARSHSRPPTVTTAWVYSAHHVSGCG